MEKHVDQIDLRNGMDHDSQVEPDEGTFQEEREIYEEEEDLMTQQKSLAPARRKEGVQRQGDHADQRMPPRTYGRRV